MSDITVIAIYMRLSQDDGDSDTESGSIVNQRHLLRRYTAEHFENYDLLEFQDDGYTGSNFNRPGVSEMLNKVRNGQIDCIIVKDLSRFSRDYIEIGSYLEQIFPFAGVRFISVNDGYDSNDFNEYIEGINLSFKNLMNDFYCKDISLKVKAALKVKKEKGIYANGSCPFGYRKAPDDRHKLLVDKEEAAVVRKIFSMTMDGASSREIARQFNMEGVKTPIEHRIEKGLTNMEPKRRRFEWSSSVVCQILSNAVYRGDFVYDKYETPQVGGKAKLKPRNEWKVLKNHHEEVIDRDTFEYIQESRRNKRPMRNNGSVRNNRHPLIGRMECGCCHRSLKIERTKNPYFFCGNRSVTRFEGCVDKANVQFVEQYLLFHLQEEIEKRTAPDEREESFTEVTQEVADRFIKKIVIYDENQIEIEWNSL